MYEVCSHEMEHVRVSSANCITNGTYWEKMDTTHAEVPPSTSAVHWASKTPGVRVMYSKDDGILLRVNRYYLYLYYLASKTTQYGY